MATLNFGLLCEFSIISTDGTPSFISVFSQIIGEKIPFVRPEIHIVTNYFLEESEVDKTSELEIIIISPSGKKISSMKSKILKKENSKGNQSGFISVMRGIKFEEWGTHNFEVFLNGNMIGKLPLLISEK